MERQTFIKGLKKLCAYYERSIPQRETIDMWLAKVQHLPDECASWITDQITDSSERWPSNLPGAMLKLWPQWLNAHPENRAYSSESGCDQCENGVLHVRDKDGYQCVFRCACLKSDLVTLRVASLNDLLNAGYTVNGLDEAARWRVQSKGRSSSNINWSDYLGDIE